MTEDEASEKWCPFVRVGMPVGGSMNRDVQGYHEAVSNKKHFNCIGSDCMAWRWKEDTTRSVTRKGYCGLAGNP